MRARVVASLGLGEEEDWNRRGGGLRRGVGWEKRVGEWGWGFRRSWRRDITFGIERSSRRGGIVRG
jgi:hypothetical protein